MARYLITGSSGFIGKGLTKELRKAGHEVMTLKLREDNLYRSLTHWDYIINLSAYGNKYDQSDEAQIITANTLELFDLLFATIGMKYKAFLNISTSGHILECDSFYGATKMAGEYLARAFARKYDLPLVNVRPYSVYGEGDDPAHFIPTAIQAFQTNSELKLAPGIHDWIHVEDVVAALLVIAENAQELKGKSVDVGSGLEISNHAVISMLRTATGKPGRIIEVEQMRDYDTHSWRADTSLLRKLGWEPKHDLEEDLYNLANDPKQGLKT